ncbi:putative reverse transcriptase domain-containing protein [Tanacetum coccineum]
MEDSGGMNGYLSLSSSSPVVGMDDIMDNQVICAIFMLPDYHNHLTRPPVRVKILKKVNKARVVSSASSAVTYTSVYTDSEPGRVFWGADEEIYDGEPIYLEYIPLKDEHVFLVEEQPLTPVVSPTAELPEYVIESDPKEDPEEYEDDETEDGPVNYPMDGGDNRDDDDGDSSGDDVDDEDEDEEDDEEEEHPAPADSAVVVPTIEPVSPPEGTEPVITPPSTDISTTGARITVRLQASISLPPEVEVERLLAMTTPLPSPPISLSPPFARERLARCTAPPAHSSPPPMPSPLPPSSRCQTQIQTLRIASTQALINAVTSALPSPPLPPLPPSLYIPPPVDRRNDLPESEDTWVDPAEAVPEIAPMTVGEVNTRVIDLAELHECDTHDLYALLEDAQDGDSMDGRGGGLCVPRGLGSLDRNESGDPSGASDPL